MTMIIADGFSEATAPHEEHDPIGHYLHELGNLADELNETTLTPEGCDQWVSDIDKLMSAAIVINIACRRVGIRRQETRAPRRLVEIA